MLVRIHLLIDELFTTGGSNLLVRIHLLIDELFTTGDSNLLVQIHLLIDELSALPTGLILEITNAYKKSRPHGRLFCNTL